MGESVQITEGVITDSDGNKDGLKFANSVSIGSVTLTSQAGAINSLVANGSILGAHDALYAFWLDMASTAGADNETAQDEGFPRRVGLVDGATHRVKWVWQIPAEWDAVDVRFAWNKSGATSGNVKFQFWYGLFYPFASPDVNSLAGTTVSMAAIAVPSGNAQMTYSLPSELVGLPIADGAFGSKPFMVCSLSRLGADAADTYTGEVQVEVATLTRTG